MKKLLLTILAAGSLTAAEAQSAGSILVYGNLGVMLDNEKNHNAFTGFDTTYTNKWVSASFHPGVGFAVAENMVVGIQFGADYMRYRPQESSFLTYKESDILWHAGAFFRYTKPLGNIFTVFGQFNGSYLSGNHQYNWEFSGPGALPDSNLKDTYSGFEVGIVPAIGVNVTKCISLNFGFGGIGYRSLKTEFDDVTRYNVPGLVNEVTNSNFVFTFGQQFNVGLNWVIGGSHSRKAGGREPMSETRDIDTSDDTPKRKSSSDDDE